MVPSCTSGGQIQRVGHRLLRREVKTESSEAPLPLPDLSVNAIWLRQSQQDADRERSGHSWIDTGLVFARHGTPIEPRDFGRSFDRCIVAAGCPGSPSTARARHVLRCWPHWTFTRESRCASCGTARSRSRWRSTPRRRRLPPVRRSASSATGLHDGRCRLLLPVDRQRPLSPVGDTAIEPVTSSV
jgi:hypothetical protein